MTLAAKGTLRTGAVRCCGVYVFHLPAPKRLSWALKTQPQQPRLHTTLAVVPALDSCGLFNVSRVNHVNPFSGLARHSLPKEYDETSRPYQKNEELQLTDGQKVAFHGSTYVHVCTNTSSKLCQVYIKTTNQQVTFSSLLCAVHSSYRSEMKCAVTKRHCVRTGRLGEAALNLNRTNVSPREFLELQPPTAKTAKNGGGIRLEGVGKNGKGPKF